MLLICQIVSAYLLHGYLQITLVRLWLDHSNKFNKFSSVEDNLLLI